LKHAAYCRTEVMHGARRYKTYQRDEMVRDAGRDQNETLVYVSRRLQDRDVATGTTSLHAKCTSHQGLERISLCLATLL